MKTNKRKVTVRANQSRRTFTIRTFFGGKRIAKYRTNVFSSEEFDSLERNTEKDWEQFLKTDEYYEVRS